MSVYHLSVGQAGGEEVTFLALYEQITFEGYQYSHKYSNPINTRSDA